MCDTMCDTFCLFFSLVSRHTTHRKVQNRSVSFCFMGYFTTLRYNYCVINLWYGGHEIPEIRYALISRSTTGLEEIMSVKKHSEAQKLFINTKR